MRPAGGAGRSGWPPCVTTAATVWLGLWVTPPDQVQGNLVRLLYLHPPVAWVALYLAFGLAALSSLLYLWRRTRSLFWDRLAAAAVEVGVVFNALTLVTGSLWGRPTWGVWWTWDARLTTTALLLVLFLGYLALRRVPAEPDVRARRCAVAALVAFVDVPIVHFSVDVVADPPPERHGPQPRRCTRDDPRVDGLDAAARVRRPHPRLRLDGRRPLPHRGAARTGSATRSSRSPWPSAGPEGSEVVGATTAGAAAGRPAPEPAGGPR